MVDSMGEMMIAQGDHVVMAALRPRDLRPSAIVMKGMADGVGRADRRKAQGVSSASRSLLSGLSSCGAGFKPFESGIYRFKVGNASAA
jgi:hypothetical protein